MTINSLTGEFASRATEAAFLDHKQAQTRATLAFTLAFCAIYYLCFTATDLVALGAGHKFAQLFGARMLVAITSGACAWLAWRQPLTVRATRLAASIAETVALGCFMFMAALRPDEVHWHAMSLAIMLVVVYLYIPNRLGYAVGLAMLATGGFMLLALKVAPIPRTDVIRMSMMLFLANAFGASAARRFNRVSREEYRAHTELLYAAERDHLTGCYNRRYLHDHLMGAELARAQRFGHSLTVLLCDIDHFKRINDPYGHAAGDAVIVAIASLLSGSLRGSDRLSRFGGEEFVVLLRDVDEAVIEAWADRTRKKIEDVAILWQGQPLKVTISIGATTVAADDRDIEDVIHRADLALYAAKSEGRNRVNLHRSPLALSA